MARRPAGEYIYPVTVSTYSETPNGSGQLIPTAATYCGAFARIAIPNGREIVLPEGQQTLAINEVLLAVPYDSKTSGINAEMVITFNANEYQITAARDATGRREEILINAIQRT